MKPWRRRSLVFSPLAWLKMQFLCHLGPTEVGAFAISATERPLYIHEVVTVQQQCSAATVCFDDTAVADYFDQCVDQGLKPDQFARLWVHTHPGSSALPSGTDEETFQRVFGPTDWAVMMILSRTGRTYARLQVNSGPGACCLLRCRVDWESWPQQMAEAPLAQLLDDWLQEYESNVERLRAPSERFPIPFSLSRTLTDQQLDAERWWSEAFWEPAGDHLHEYPLP